MGASGGGGATPCWGVPRREGDAVSSGTAPPAAAAPRVARAGPCAPVSPRRVRPARLVLVSLSSRPLSTGVGCARTVCRTCFACLCFVGAFGRRGYFFLCVCPTRQTPVGGPTVPASGCRGAHTSSQRRCGCGPLDGAAGSRARAPSWGWPTRGEAGWGAPGKVLGVHGTHGTTPARTGMGRHLGCRGPNSVNDMRPTMKENKYVHVHTHVQWSAHHARRDAARPPHGRPPFPRLSRLLSWWPPWPQPAAASAWPRPHSAAP